VKARKPLLSVQALPTSMQKDVVAFLESLVLYKLPTSE